MRRVLLSKLSGNGSFKNNDNKHSSTLEIVTSVDKDGDNMESVGIYVGSGDVNNEAVSSTDTDVPARCGECRHHCYYNNPNLRK